MFGEQIRSARLQAGLSEAQLARQAGINRTQLRLLERDRNVALSTLLKIVAQLPNLTHLRLKPSEPLQMVDAPAVRDVAARLEAAARTLRNLTGDTAAGFHVEYGTSNLTVTSLPPEQERRLLEIDASIAAGTPEVAPKV